MNKVLTAMLVGVILMVSTAWAEAIDDCEVLAPPTAAGLTSFAEDNNYDLRVEAQDDGVAVRIIGDTLIIEEQTYRSLVRDSSKPITNVIELVLDARKIVLQAPISLDHGKIVLLADTVEIAGWGQLTLTTADPEKIAQLDIHCRRLIFTAGLKRPLRIPDIGSPGRSVSIAAREVVDAGTAIPADQAGAFVWSKTLASAFVGAPSSGWQVHVGDVGDQHYMESLNRNGLWPLRFPGKLAAHLARDPYGDDNRQSIDEAIENALPTLTGWRSAGPVLEALRIREYIKQGVDLGGRSAAYAPRRDLNNQLQELENDLDGFRQPSSYLADLRTLYLASLERKVLDKKAVDRARKTSDETVARTRELRSRLNSSITEMATLAQEAAGLQPVIEQRRKTLELLTERELKRARDASSLKQWTNVGASVVALGAMLIPGGQAIGAGIAAGISAGGEIAYQHNTKGMGWSDLSGVLQKGSTFYQSAMSLPEKWDDYKRRERDLRKVLSGEKVLDGPNPPAGEPDKREALGKGAAAGRAAKAFGEFASSVGSLVKDSGGPGPTPISLAERENRDPELMTLINRLAGLAKQQSDFLLQIESDTKAIAMAEAALQSYRANLAELLASDPVNDLDFYRWQTHSRELWIGELSRIADKAVVLRRSLFFETGKIPDGPADVLYFPEEYAAFLDYGDRDPFTAYSGSELHNRLQSHLEREEKKFLVSIEALIRGVRAARDAYLSSRTEADVYRFSQRFRSKSSKDSEAAFVAALNGQIAQQIAFKQEIASVLPAPLPYELPDPIVPFPERLVTVKISGVKFVNPRIELHGSGLRFHILHPGYGRIIRGGTCALFDLRIPGAVNVRPFITDINAVDPDWPREQPTRIQLTGTDRFYTHYPARTVYSVLAQVTSSDNWRRVPQIDEIEISFEIMQ
jgi:hypothetical protein